MRAINLLPLEQRAGGPSTPSTQLSPWHAIFGVGALVLVVLLGMWAMARNDVTTAHKAKAAAVARSAVAQAQVDRLLPVMALDQRRTTRERSVVQLTSGRTDWAMVLRSVAGALPDEVGVRTLALQAASASGQGSGAIPAGLGGSGSVAIGACADNQPRVATTLRALRELPQVADVALNQTSRTDAKSTDSSGPQDCPDVSVDAAVGLSPATALDPVDAATSGTATTGAGATTGTATAGPTAESTPKTTGAAR